MTLQYIQDPQGKPLYVVLPVQEYEQLQRFKQLMTAQDEIDDEAQWAGIDYEAGANDEESIPNEVVNLMFDKDCSLLNAWRLYRGLSQQEVAYHTGLTQPAISQAERKESKPQRKTLERLAQVYQCKPKQLTLD